MGTDSTTEQLNQCLTALSNANVHWWDALAITQAESDQITLLLLKFLLGCLIFALVRLILKTLW